MHKCFRREGGKGERGGVGEREIESEGERKEATSSLVCNLDELLQYGTPPCQFLLPAYLCNHPGMNLQTYHIQSTLHEPIWFFVSNDLVEPSFKDVKVCRCPVDLKCSIHQLHLQRTSTTLNHQLASLNHTVTGGAGK